MGKWLLVLVAGILPLSVLPQCGGMGGQPELTVLYTGSGNGTLLGCTCPDSLFGGLPRRATLLKKYRGNHPNTLVLEVGDFLSTYPSPDNDRAILGTYRILNYDALNLGDQEFIDGGGLVTVFRDSLPLVSGSIMNAGNGMFLVSEAIIKEINGLTIRVLGLVTPECFDLRTPDGLPGIRINGAEKALALCLAGPIKNKIDMTILLSQGGYSVDSLLAAKYPVLDLILGPEENGADAGPVRLGKTLRVGYRGGEYLGILTVRPGAKGGLEVLESRQEPIIARVPEDPAVRRFIAGITGT